jgi:cytochrome b561
MNNETSKPIKILCILSFVVVAITSIPLLVTYLKGASPKYQFVTDLHVWAGFVFIFFAVLRIIRTKFSGQK